MSILMKIWFGYLWTLLAASAQHCPNPSTLQFTPTYVHVYVKIDLFALNIYSCELTINTYLRKCDGNLGNIVHTKKLPVHRRNLDQNDAINCFNDCRKCFIKNTKINPHTSTTRGQIFNNGTCRGTNINSYTDVIEQTNFTVNFKKYIAQIDLLRDIFIKQLYQCNVNDEFCEPNKYQKMFWNVDRRWTGENKTIRFEIRGNKYTLYKKPLVQYVVWKQNDTKLALQVLKRDTFPNTRISFYNTDQEDLLLSFDEVYYDSLDGKDYDRVMNNLLKFSPSDIVYEYMKFNCELQVITEHLKANETSNKIKIAHMENEFCIIFTLFMLCLFAKSVFSIIINYFTLRQVIAKDKKTNKFCILHSLNQAMCLRYVQENLQRRYDQLEAKLISEVDTQIDTNRTEKQEKKLQNEYSYVRLSGYLAPVNYTHHYDTPS